MIQVVLGLIQVAYLVVVLLFACVVINILQVLSYGLLLVLPSHSVLDVRRRLSNLWWALWPYMFEQWGGVRYVYTGDKPRAGENAILMSNHNATLDFVNGVMLSARVDGLGCGRMMTMMKKVLQYVPTVGWINYLQGSMFLERVWDKDHGAIANRLQDIEELRFPRPFWIGLYPEGTRFTAAKHAKSVEYAKKEGLPVLDHLLVPRTKGFVFLVTHLPSALNAVYDCTIAYKDNKTIRLSKLLKSGRLDASEVHIHIKRVPLSELPTESDKLGKWLHGAWQRKEELLQHFDEHGSFSAESVHFSNHTMKHLLIFVLWSLLLLYVLLSTYALPVWAVALVLGAQLLTITTSFSHHGDGVQ